MKKLLAVLSVATLLLPAVASAAYNDVSLTTDTVLSVNGITLNVSGSTAAVQSITVNSTNFSVDLVSGSSFQVTALGLEKLSADTLTGIASDVCNNTQSLLKYAPSTGVTVTITPSTALCSATNVGGDGGSTTTSTTNNANNNNGGGGGSAASTAPATSAITTVTTATPATPATPASGLSSTQVQSILDVLASFDVDAATMASVKTALEGTATGSVTSAAVHAFKSNLTVGSLGSEVKALQEFLNGHGYAVATSGAGSLGNETTRFGAATKAALIKYQKANGITPAAGYFGAKTRAAINSGE